jgi:putative ABC transport system ATP-binding protein
MDRAAPADDLALEVRGVAKSFGEGETRVEALRGVDLDVRRGEFVVVMGPSGSGKSTLLHLVAGLDRPSAGTIRVAGADLAAMDDDALTVLRRRRVGLVFQAFHLVHVLTAEENVALPLLVDGVPAAEAGRRATEALERVGLGARRGHLPGALSGGEQQRVALARATVAEPAVVLADEPTGNLDSARGEEVMALLRSVVDEGGRSVLMVTHDVRAAAHGDRIVWLRDGRAVASQTLGPGSSVHEVVARLESLT